MTSISVRTKIKALLAICCLCLCPYAGITEASITTLTELDFLELAPQGQLYIETLETFGTGGYDTPLALSNSMFAVDSGSAYIDTISRDGGFTNILRGTSIMGGRAFTLFPDSTVAWAADLALEAVGLGDQQFEVSVIGNSGTATFYFDKNDFDPYFAGFYDPTGLVSVEFQNLGFSTGNGTQFSNYDFDDIMTLSRVPLPASVWLFGSGLFPLAVAYGRRNRKLR